MNEYDTKLSERIKALGKAIDHIAKQTIPKMTEIAKEKHLETQYELNNEEFIVTITAGEFWAITEACGTYKGGMLNYLDKQKRIAEQEAQRQAAIKENANKVAERETRLKEFRSSLSVGQRIRIGEIRKYGKDQWMSGYRGEILKLNKTSVTVRLDGYPDEKHYVKYALIEPVGE